MMVLYEKNPNKNKDGLSIPHFIQCHKPLYLLMLLLKYRASPKLLARDLNMQKTIANSNEFSNIKFKITTSSRKLIQSYEIVAKLPN